MYICKYKSKFIYRLAIEDIALTMDMANVYMWSHPS